MLHPPPSVRHPLPFATVIGYGETVFGYGETFAVNCYDETVMMIGETLAYFLQPST